MEPRNAASDCQQSPSPDCSLMWVRWVGVLFFVGPFQETSLLPESIPPLAHGPHSTLWLRAPASLLSYCPWLRQTRTKWHVLRRSMVASSVTLYPEFA